MTVFEIQDQMESYARREKQKLKQKLAGWHFLAKDIARYVGLLFENDNTVRVPELWDYFPELFAEEAKKAQEEEMKEYKAKMYDFAYRHNHKKERR